MNVYKNINHLYKKYISIPHKCVLCNKILKSPAGISHHLRVKHNLKYIDYIISYLNVDLNSLKEEWDNKKNQRKNNQLKGLKERAKKLKGVPIKSRMSEEEYINFRKKMKGVFSKEWYIKKYGERIGIEKYNQRIKKISETSFWRKYNKENKENWSKVSQELFWQIYKRINKIYKEIYFGELNHEYGCETNQNFDFVVKDNKKIIEFNGDKFHANPNMFKEDDIPLKFLNKTSKEIWKNDIDKYQIAKNNGYEIKIIWESDYYNNKEKIILECLDFIYEKIS